MSRWTSLTPEEKRAEYRRQQEAIYGTERNYGHAAAGLTMEQRITREEIAARRKEMPKDDPRDLTARLMGDPIPNDRRRQL
jgi:hypothetical protein